MKDRTLAIATLAFLVAFLYQMSEVLKTHACWCDYATPPGVGEIAFALVMGLCAIGAACGLDLKSLLAGFRKQE